MNALKKAVFLDRDETLNVDPGYISDPGVLRLHVGVAKALRSLKDAGFLLVVVSNQSGISRGFITEEQLFAVNRRLNELLKAEADVGIDHFQWCPHHPEDGCECRKPKPKLILDAAKALSIDVSQSYLIGDRDSDIQCGTSAGCRKCYLIDHDDSGSFTSAVKSILAAS